MSSRLKSILFAAGLCAVCSLLLTAASSGLKPFHQRNMLTDRQKNILKSVGLIDERQSLDAAAIARRYADNISELWADATGRIVTEKTGRPADLPIYLYRKENVIRAYVVPINSRGLWGKIHGYLAINADGETISGFTVYKHSETPGLGGEIEKRWFQKNFVGKKIVDQHGDFVSISIVKGAVQDKIAGPRQINYVDGISGATLTGKFLSAGLKSVLTRYEPVSIRFRKNLVKKDAHEPQPQ